MEIQGEDGSKIELVNGSKTVFGRGAGFSTKDRTVSRHHVTFELEKTINQTEPRVSFQVTGRNPVWVRNGRAEREVKVFRRFEKGEMAAGDWFCISSETPVWFRLRERVAEDGGGSFDLSKIDPVKEFGFLVTGHEFDCYPKQRIKSAKNWDWFLKEMEKDREDGDGDDERKNKREKGKRKKRVEGDDDDDDWTGESEDEKEILAKARKVERTKYSTRSKEGNKLRDDMKRKEDSGRRSVRSNEDGDETLGGFIVEEEEEEVGEGSDEEEEFIDDDYEEEERDD